MLELSGYIEFQKGNLPLILSVPHGGTLECENIPKRTSGILGIDVKTIEIAKNLITILQTNFKQKTSIVKTPSYVISMVHRSKIDLNREKTEAYMQESYLAKEIYEFYHKKIEEIVLHNLKVYNHSLLIDLHGFEKASRPPGFRDVDIVLGTNNLESFFPAKVPKKEWGKNIRGKIVQKFLDLDIPIAPSHPTRSEYVLTGGYITKKYGASQIPKSQAIQIELSDRIRLKDRGLREIVLDALAQILFEDFKNFKNK
jgi:N-formylglutamate amidohydrolase